MESTHFKSLMTVVLLAVLIYSFQVQPAHGELPSISSELPKEIPVTTTSEAALQYFNAGQDAMDLGKFIEARELFTKAVEKDPDFAYALLNIANSSASFDEFKKYTVKAAAKAEYASEGEQILIKINQTFLDNSNEKRLKLANKLVYKYPNSARAHLSLAGVLGSRNHHDKARQTLQKAIEMNPDLVATYLALGNSYLFNDPKDFKQAEKYMVKATKVRTDEAAPFIGLGDVYRAAQDLIKSRDAYASATYKDPENAIAILKKGHINSFLGNYNEARSDYDAALKFAKEGQKASYANYRAFTYLHEDNPKMAVKELQGILDGIDNMDMPEDQRDGTAIFTLTNQAHILLKNGMLDEARTCLDKRAKHMLNIADLVGTPQVKANQKANIAVWDGLLATYKGDYEKAEMMAQKNKELLADNDNPRKMEAYHNLVGMISLKKGDFAEAAKHFKQANLNDIYVKYHLAEALRELGDDASLALYKEVSEYNFNSVEYAMVRKDAQRRSVIAAN